MTGKGKFCGSQRGLKITKLGPLCAKHAELCKSDTNSGSSNGDSNGAGSAAERSVSPEESAEEVSSSPENDIKLPGSKAALAKEKEAKGSFKYGVVAVRTFPDSARPKSAAGSVWLSWEKADLSNKKGGVMKSFRALKDIFGNIASAKAWIEEQVATTEDSGEGSSEETERRMQAAMAAADSNGAKSKSKNKRKKKAGRKKKSNTDKAPKNNKKSSRASKKKSENTTSGAGGGGDPDDSSEEDDEESDDERPTGMFGSEFRRRRRKRGVRKGGLRSGATRLLDKMQSRIQKQLFQPDADPVVVLTEDPPVLHNCNKIPLPGKAQALTVSADSKHVIAFDNGGRAVLASQTFKSFKAFSLADLMEFDQMVEYIGECQPEESRSLAVSVVAGVKQIARNAIRTHAALRDTGKLGMNGENLRAYNYLQVYHLVMFREVFDGSMAEMFWMGYAQDFAIRARGCPGMGPVARGEQSEKPSKASGTMRCLFCGKAGHRADSEVHQDELAVGGAGHSNMQLRQALAEIASDRTLSAAQKKTWSVRTRAFWATVHAKDQNDDAVASS